jgi:type II secretory pathway pseudopilin PulG
MVVIVIMGMLSLAGLVSFRSAGQSARNGKREADLSTVQQALQLYKVDTGTYPIYTGSSTDAMAQNYVSMIADLQDDSYLSQTVQDPKFVSLGQAIGGSNRSYLYKSNAVGSMYDLYYLKEPNTDLIHKANP